MKLKLPIWIAWFLLIGVIIIVVVLILAEKGGTRTCIRGGFSVSISRIHSIMELAISEAANAPDHVFRFTDTNDERREMFASEATLFQKVHFLVTIHPVHFPLAEIIPRRIMVVCDTPFNKDPSQWFFPDPKTHAVVYSDLTDGQLTPDEFAALDRSEFKRLDELYPPKPNE